MKNNLSNLSIGTVVILKNMEKEIMIFAKKVIRKPEDKEYDYVACLYPEGYLGDNYNIFFNAKEIKKVSRILTSDTNIINNILNLNNSNDEEI